MFEPGARKIVRRFAHRFLGDRRGQTSVVFGLSVVALTGAIGTSLDSSAMHRSGAQLQDAVDASALYAVRSAAVKNLSDSAVRSATEVFLKSSYEGEGSAADHDPADRPLELTSTEVLSRSPVKVQVSATRSVRLPFGFLRGEDGRVEITRVSTAVEALETPITLLLLDRTSASAWRAVGTSGLVALDGAAIVNSNSPQALDGGGTADIETAGTLVVGPPSTAGNWTPRPFFRASPVNDPYKNKLVWPATGSCTATNLQVKKQTLTLQPGTYCGGLSVATHGDVTLAPGTYVLTGPLTVTSGAKLNAPRDVTIVLKGETSYVQFQAGSSVTLRAPKTGAWEDIALAQAPQATEKVSTLIGGAELNMDGVMYLPTQKVVVTGGAASEVLVGSRILIANRLETSGNGMIYLRGNADVATVKLGARLAS